MGDNLGPFGLSRGCNVISSGVDPTDAERIRLGRYGVTHHGSSPTSSSLKTKFLHIKGIGCGLVTIWRLDPSVLWGDDVRGYCEVAIDLLDVGFWRGGLADAQT